MGLEAIELRHLRFFMALAEELNFGRAAERCNVSQPPFSVAIQQLESHLDVALVFRSSRQVALTPAGQAFYVRVQRLMTQAGDAYTVARSVAAGKKGRLRVGFHASMLYRGLSDMVAALERDEPLLEIELLEMPSQEQVAALLAGRLDVGFGHSTIVPDLLASTTVLNEPFMACVPPGHPILYESKFSLDMLKDERFIFFWRSASPTYFDRIVSLCVEAGFTPNVRHQVRQWLTVVAMVGQGMGVAIVPQCLARSGMRAAFVPLPNPASSSVQCMWLASHEEPLVMRLVEYARKYIRPIAPGVEGQAETER